MKKNRQKNKSVSWVAATSVCVCIWFLVRFLMNWICAHFQCSRFYSFNFPFLLPIQFFSSLCPGRIFMCLFDTKHLEMNYMLAHASNNIKSNFHTFHTLASSTSIRPRSFDRETGYKYMVGSMMRESEERDYYLSFSMWTKPFPFVDCPRDKTMISFTITSNRLSITNWQTNNRHNSTWSWRTSIFHLGKLYKITKQKRRQEKRKKMKYESESTMCGTGVWICRNLLSRLNTTHSLNRGNSSKCVYVLFV